MIEGCPSGNKHEGEEGLSDVNTIVGTVPTTNTSPMDGPTCNMPLLDEWGMLRYTRTTGSRDFRSLEGMYGGFETMRSKVPWVLLRKATNSSRLA
eukprot:1380958-Amorphochlora_amoeboformis.AAC.1